QVVGVHASMQVSAADATRQRLYKDLTGPRLRLRNLTDDDLTLPEYSCTHGGSLCWLVSAPQARQSCRGVSATAVHLTRRGKLYGRLIGGGRQLLPLHGTAADAIDAKLYSLATSRLRDLSATGAPQLGHWRRIGSLPSQPTAATRIASKMRIRAGVASAISITVPG